MKMIAPPVKTVEYWENNPAHFIENVFKIELTAFQKQVLSAIVAKSKQMRGENSKDD